MVIERIVNNNVVFSRDEKGQEIIVTGRGISFNKKVGMEIEEDRIEKIFTTKELGNNSKIEDILKDIPIEYFEISSSILAYAVKVLDKRLNESIYLSLTDHIHTTVKRFSEGVSLKNPMLWDIKRFYPDEFKVGTKALTIIDEKLKVKLPLDEAGFISLHLVNASMDEDLETIYELTTLMQEISNIVKYHFSIDFDTDSVYYYRFITHLKFFAVRLTNRKMLDEREDNDLLEIIRKKYINAFQCVKKIQLFLDNQYNYKITNEEMLYLTIHIERLIYKTDN